ncbi:hypothetical protein [Butyrivibrio sp. TB]|uniref:hypothetical protein n=1 Tax=Butyrivibrio sp. TB TaxID=1520809 RepID=UPI0008D6ABFE|nr:hypothetical protein [Butyrivibrio sp. TB]SEQ36414.1 hypothetical protein SAMN02910382_02775 [Butyrivibrio sp. TB]
MQRIKLSSIANKLKEVFGYFKTLKVIDAVLLAAALLFSFLTMYYADITVTGQYGLTFWDSLFDGKILSFYENALSSGVAPEGAVYDIGTYIIFGIWQLPIWILNKVLGVSALSVGALLWLKLLPVLFLLLTTYETAELSFKLGISDTLKAQVGIVFLTSLITYLPVMVVAQYDVIPLYFMVRAINAYVDRDDKSFYISFAISMTVKPLTILALFVLIILREKNVVRIVVDLIKGSFLMIICKAVYSMNEAYKLSCSGFLQKNMPSLFDASVNMGRLGNASLFIIGLIVVYLVAYFDESYLDASKEGAVAEHISIDRKALLYVFGVWAVFVAFASATCYWTIYMAPFVILVCFMCGRYLDKVLLVETIMECALTVLMVLSFSWVYGGDMTYGYLILKGFCGKAIAGEDGKTIAGLLNWILSTEELGPAICGVFVACLVTIGILAYRFIRNRTARNEDFSENEKNLLDRCNLWIIRLRIVIICGWVIATLGALYMTGI